MAGTIGEKTDVGIYLVATNNLMFQPGPLTEAQLNADPAQANAGYVTRNERRFNRTGRLGVTVEHRLDSTLSLTSTFYVNPKYLQRSERNTFRDFTRYHFGGSVMGRKAFTTGAARSQLTWAPTMRTRMARFFSTISHLKASEGKLSRTTRPRG